MAMTARRTQREEILTDHVQHERYWVVIYPRPTNDVGSESQRRRPVITFGIILLIAGALLDIGLLYTIGGLLLVVGVVLLIAGALGHAIGGRPHYY